MTTEQQLDTIESFIDEMNFSNSLLDKQAVLRRHPELKTLLGLIYGPKKFNISSATVIKNLDLAGDGLEKDSIEELLESLTTREVTGHAAIATVLRFADTYGHIETLYKILDKDLEIRVGASVINKVYPGCVDIFEVALANSYKDVEKKVNIFDGGWYASRKMDGVRCIAIVDAKGEVEFFSREGKPFDTFGVLGAEIEKLGIVNAVFDGECCIVDKDGKEDFKAVTKEMRKKDHTIKNPKYLMFDMLTLDEFFALSSKEKFSDRLGRLNRIVKKGSKSLEVLEQHLITPETFDKLQEKVKEFGWEGLILRKNVGYKAKRSNDLLKVKSFHDAEYKVLSIETGPFRMIIDGLEGTETTMTAVNIEHKGNRVSVGSGWTIAERKEYFKAPAKIIGKTITVKYFEETSNASGSVSLRFPIFVGIRDYE